ncbi:MAG: chorismate synthase [Eubacteriales bacterium]|nr:chorismate synthase [Eubacteriales bacterium]
MSFSFGQRYRVTLFGQSHGPSVGVVIDGLPAGETVDPETLNAFLQRRAPGGRYATQRRETDIPEILSGLVDGKSCGAPITVVFHNGDTNSGDYASFSSVPRPSHADYPALVKYGDAHDIRGGGYFSARLTAALCFAGGVALQALARRGVAVGAHLCRVGAAEDLPFDPVNLTAETLLAPGRAAFPTLDARAADAMRAEIERARMDCDSVGGAVECASVGLPVGLGEPVFGGVENRICQALFAVPAVRGVEFGAGFAAASMRGSAHNDPYILQNGQVRTAANHHGGVLGGLTSGMPLIFRAAFKPTPSIGQPQRTLNVRTGEETTLTIAGRHDPCVALRAVPCVEAAAAIALLDLML